MGPVYNNDAVRFAGMASEALGDDSEVVHELARMVALSNKLNARRVKALFESLDKVQRAAFAEAVYLAMCKATEEDFGDALILLGQYVDDFLIMAKQEFGVSTTRGW